jgi:trigger factor
VEVTVQSLSDVSREVEIIATPEDLAPHFDKAYLEYRKKIEIRGFRKGKAPMDIVKKL